MWISVVKTEEEFAVPLRSIQDSLLNLPKMNWEDSMGPWRSTCSKLCQWCVCYFSVDVIQPLFISVWACIFWWSVYWYWIWQRPHFGPKFCADKGSYPDMPNFDWDAIGEIEVQRIHTVKPQRMKFTKQTSSLSTLGIKLKTLLNNGHVFQGKVCDRGALLDEWFDFSVWNICTYSLLVMLLVYKIDLQS